MKFKVLFLLFFGITTSIYSQKTKKVVASKRPFATVQKLNLTANEGIFAEFETTKGKIVVVLEYKKTPITVANFVSLIEGTNTFVTDEKLKGKPFYNGLKFHRVIKDFMIQGGDPAGNGSGGCGYSFKDEFVPELKHDKGGILSMANSGPATNSSQFFITHKDTPWLNGKHTVFGHVVKGMEVVNAIVQDDVILKVTVSRVGAEAKKFDAPKVFSDYYANKAVEDAKQNAAQSEAQAAARKIYDEKYAPIKAAKVTELEAIRATATKSETGLEYKIIQKGAGVKPTDGANVFIHYAGYLEDGSLFDSSYEEVNKICGKFDQNRASQNGYQPFPFQYGKKDGLIPGFIEGLNAMSFGDKAVVFIPSKLGYGERGAGNVIPPNANIIFEIELLEGIPPPVAAEAK
ncbi:MAG: peptidylprolyl isomerase [Flavobacteriaceae bacterium]|nr:peptidylprolyl isomerase [Flavobacteriaceae bacterium]